jgi:hypothetical protein
VRWPLLWLHTFIFIFPSLPSLLLSSTSASTITVPPVVSSVCPPFISPSSFSFPPHPYSTVIKRLCWRKITSWSTLLGHPGSEKVHMAFVTRFSNLEVVIWGNAWASPYHKSCAVSLTTSKKKKWNKSLYFHESTHRNNTAAKENKRLARS